MLELLLPGRRSIPELGNDCELSRTRLLLLRVPEQTLSERILIEREMGVSALPIPRLTFNHPCLNMFETESHMPRNWLLAAGAVAVAAVVLAIPAPMPAAPLAQEKKDDLKKRVEEAVEKGLEWLKRTQAQDGHWEAQGGQYPTTMTALAGMCFLMEGSTLKEGKYSDQVQKAVKWFLAPNRQQPSGLLGDIRNPTES